MQADFIRPRALGDVTAALAADPDILLLAGGTDLLVEINLHGRRPPGSVLALRDVRGELSGRSDGRLGAMTTYRELLEPEVAAAMPALAQAARTVGSPQIRQWGTIGGNLGTASPAGDALPPLLVYDAQVELTSATGTRLVPLGEFLTGVKRNAREPDEVITAVVDVDAAGQQHFAKVGTRNAMVIAVCSLAMRLDRERSLVRLAIGSAAPTVRRLPEVEAWLAAELDAAAWRSSDALRTELGRRVAAGAAPIDDVRGSAAYRRHALGVLAGRCLAWCTEV